MSYQLGVDVGTTYTAAAVFRDGRAQVVSLGTRIAEIPSVVYLLEDGEFLVGEAAVRRGAAQPNRLAREFKRRLGDSVPLLLAGSPHSAQSLTGRVLRFVFDTVTAREGERPESTVVTYPANWGPFKQELLDQAIRVADLPDARTATEPEAAAVHYASGTRVAPGAVIAVYDLGGGTFDAAVLRKSPTGFELLGRPEGLEHLGGIDFDEAVYQHVLGWLGGAAEQLDRTDPAVVSAIARLRRECVEAKEALSVDSVVSIPVLLPNASNEIRLTRGEFEAMIRPALTETMQALRRGLRSAGFEEGGITTVVLVGGSSRIPLVAELVQAELGVPVAIDAHPKHTIALGAALLAAPGAAVVEPSAPAPGNRAAAGGSSAQGAPPPPPPEAAPGRAALPPPTTPGRAAPDAGEQVSAPPAGADELPAYPPPAPATRRGVPRLAIGLAAAAVAVVIALVVALSGGGDGGGAADTSAAPPTASSAPSGSTSSTGPTATTIPIPTAAAPAPDDVILYTSVRGDNWDIFSVQADGTGERQLTTNPARDLLAVWSPDRRSVAHSREAGAWGVRIVSADGGTEVALSDELAADARVAWSPDGRRLAFVSERERTSDLYLLDVQTGELQKLTDDPTIEGDPAWSPDGESIALWRTIGSNQDLWILDVAETLALRTSGDGDVSGVKVTEDPGLDADPAWSPDGTQLAFSSTRNGNWDQFVMDLPSGEPTQLTTDAADDQGPAWSPDGADIAFETKRDADDAEIYVMSADGSNQRNLTNRPGLDVHAAWGPSATS